MSINPRSGIDNAYLRAFGPVEAYIKVVREDRPNRWKNLARRAFLDRPTLKYAEAFPGAIERGLSDNARRAVDALDHVVDALNAVRSEHAGQGASSSKTIPIEKLDELYERARGIIFAGPTAARPASSSPAASTASDSADTPPGP